MSPRQNPILLPSLSPIAYESFLKNLNTGQIEGAEAYPSGKARPQDGNDIAVRFAQAHGISLEQASGPIDQASTRTNKMRASRNNQIASMFGTHSQREEYPDATRSTLPEVGSQLGRASPFAFQSESGQPELQMQYEAPPFSSKYGGALSTRPDSINQFIKREVMNSVMKTVDASETEARQRRREVAQTSLKQGKKNVTRFQGSGGRENHPFLPAGGTFKKRRFTTDVNSVQYSNSKANSRMATAYMEKPVSLPRIMRTDASREASIERQSASNTSQ